MKRRLLKVLFSLALGVGLLEGLCSGLAWVKYGTLDVGELNAVDVDNSFLIDVRREGGSLIAAREPHPYLQHVYNKNFENYRADFPRRVNNVGMVGDDVPLKKDLSKLTILLTGGSVANQFGVVGNLPEVLAKQYQIGKPIVLLNLANGAWKQPQQTIAMALYGEVCDAVISLDGFNEHYKLMGRASRLEAPSEVFLDLNPIRDGSFDRVGAAWQTNQLRNFSRRHNSRVVYFLTKAIRAHIEASAQEPPQSQDVFALPESWTEAERIEYNLSQYAKYLDMMDAMADKLGIKVVHFIQPCPAIGKTLTEDERRVSKDLGCGAAYQHMTDTLVASNHRTVSLLDLYEHTPETVYADSIHCDIQGPGYRIMAERIANELARLWNSPVMSPGAGLPGCRPVR